jgi:predicted dinucleotide-binding enzyme
MFLGMANIAVLGTGMVAKAIAGKLASLGHSVKIGTRDPKATLARADKDMAGGPPIGVWLETQPKIALVTHDEAAAHGEIVWNALSGQSAIDVLESVASKLEGKVLVDNSNPLDFSKGFPPFLAVGNTDSLGEQIQRALPKTKVVKTLNTVNAFLMVDASALAGGDTTMFMCGNDAGAKEEVARLLGSFGWKDIIDLGDITNARATEAYVTLWTRLMGALKTPMFNVKVVR